MQNYLNLLYCEEKREMLPSLQFRGHRRHPVDTARARPPDARLGRDERARRDRRVRQEPVREDGRRDRKVVGALAAVATRLDRPRAQVALAWVLATSAVSAPIVGATRLEQLDDAVAALSLALAPEDIAELEAPYVPHAVVGHT